MNININGSRDYFDKFCKRNNIGLQKIYGEAASVPQEKTNKWFKKLPNLIKEYEPKDIFNVDELGLFYRLLPSKTYAEKNKKCFLGKKSKERITILLGSNMDGSEKLDLMIIGKSKNPRCFKNIKNLPVIYKNNSTSWMTNKLFEEYLKIFNQKMKKEKRQILMFIDKCPAHHFVEFSNIKMKFLPENTTSILQPMDQGVIKCFKSYYRKRIVKKLIADLMDGKTPDIKNFTLLSCVLIAKLAWNDVKQDTIKNCFRKCGFNKNQTEESGAEIHVAIESNEWKTFAKLTNIESGTFSDFVEVDDSLVTTTELSLELINQNIMKEIHENDKEDEDDDDDSETEIDEPEETQKEITMNEVKKSIEVY